MTLLALAPAGCGGSGGAHDGGHAGGSAGTGGGGSGGGAPDGGVDGGGTCSTTGTGQLVVAVTGLPAGVTMPMVRVTAGGLTMPMMLTVGTPATLPAGGGYEIDYRRVKVAPSSGVVGKAFYVSASSFAGCVATGATTTATLTYTQEPGSEHMWISVSDAPTFGNELGSFASADLAVSAAKNPTLWKTMNFDERPVGSAFDSSGNLWAPGGDAINMYPMLSLATAGAAPPAVIIHQPTTAKANFAAFDSTGNLWIARGSPGTDNSIVRYAPADQAASGTPTPGVVISNAALSNPAGLAFDSVGDLWVASKATGKVLRYFSQHLGATFTGAPDVILGATATAGAAGYGQPTGIAFDEAGTLWVAFEDHLVGFKKEQQAASADLVAPLTVNIAAGTAGLAFDESGGLWFSNALSKLQRLSKASLTAGGDATPDIVIDSSELGYAEGIALDPAPTWSPMHDWL